MWAWNVLDFSTAETGVAILPLSTRSIVLAPGLRTGRTLHGLIEAQLLQAAKERPSCRAVSANKSGAPAPSADGKNQKRFPRSDRPESLFCGSLTPSPITLNRMWLRLIHCQKRQTAPAQGLLRGGMRKKK